MMLNHSANDEQKQGIRREQLNSNEEGGSSDKSMNSHKSNDDDNVQNETHIDQDEYADKLIVTPIKKHCIDSVPNAPKKTRENAVRSGKDLRPLILW